jgi:hypothetical protein
MAECNHPKHKENFENSEEAFKRYSGKVEGYPKPVTDVYISTEKFGDICVTCFCHDMGEVIEKHPIYMDRKDSLDNVVL